MRRTRGTRGAANVGCIIWLVILGLVSYVLYKVVPVKIDLDAHPEIAEKFGVISIPAYVIVSEQGEVLRQRSGLMMPEEMLRWLENYKG